jgi:hypothetical protein
MTQPQVAVSRSVAIASPEIEQIAGWLRTIAAADQVIELRSFALQRPSSRGSRTIGGFFHTNQIHSLVEHALQLSQNSRGVYFTLNPLRHELLDVRRDRVDTVKRGEAAKDSDVLGRRWMLIDLDPSRPTNTSSSIAEKELALARSHQLKEWLAVRGFPSPIHADSGNGCHLLYRVDLGTEEQLPSQVLRTLNVSVYKSTSLLGLIG